MKTFYRPEMNVEGNQSYSPSAGKPKALIEYLKRAKIQLDIVDDFNPLDSQELGLAHDTKMVQGILDLIAPNGFGTRSAEVAKSLLYTSGSFLAAAEYSIKHKENTFSPTSGFHHAGYDYCGGFCTFNGLMIAASILLNQKLVKRIGIVDLDMHYGDGTQDIIDKKSLKVIEHYTFGALGINSRNADVWLQNLKKNLSKMENCDVIFYQAGGDPHIDDPLGGVLTTEQMKKRDQIGFETFRELNIPVVWNLAGGYQKPLEKVLKLHETTFLIAMENSYETT